jgi:transcriptional regulator with XRE-family HTH domain
MPAHRLRIRRDCTHNGKHRHGTDIAYQADRCRCDPCADAKTRADKLRERRRLNGVPSFVPAAPALAHIQKLRDQGMGWRRVAEAAGVSNSAIQQLLHEVGGRPVKVKLRPDIAAAILGVRLDLADSADVDSTGTARRLEALMANGWSRPALEAAVGLSVTAQLNARRGNPVTVATRNLVARRYEELWDTCPPAETPMERRAIVRTSNLAKRRGWPPPMAWDDDTIDNPKARPQIGRQRSKHTIVDEVAVERLKRGQQVTVNILERRTAIAQLAEAGVRTGDIAERLGMTWTAAKRTRNRITAAERRTA